MTKIDTGPYLGRAIVRVEDDRLLRGDGHYVGDLALPGGLELAFVRSPHAHARIVSIDSAAALELEGVVAIFDARDLADVPPVVVDVAREVPPKMREMIDPILRPQPMPPLATDRVMYVGQPVAAVIATDRYLAEDAAEWVSVEYDPLPAVVTVDAAAAVDAPRLNPDWTDNVAIGFTIGKGDIDAALAGAAVVVTERFESHRHIAAPIEGRGMAAAVDPMSGRLTVWAGTQLPHTVRDFVARHLGMAQSDVRVIAADVGGSFGQKGRPLPEDLVVPFAARRLGRPVKWVEDRYENLLAALHAREQTHDITIAADHDGRILAVVDDVMTNLGAYNIRGFAVPYNTATHLLGPYEVPNARISVTGYITNTMVTGPYRGTGRPEAVFAMERGLDRLAAALGMDAIELRARNLIPSEALPYDTGLTYRDGKPEVYDSGDFPRLLARAVELADVPAWRVRQAERRGDTRQIGIGVSVYIEGTGVGPFEGGAITFEPSGRFTVNTGASSTGQSHATTFAQIAADALGVDIDDIDVRGGDTESITYGFGTNASRSLVVAGNAIAEAGARVRQRLLRLAAERLEATVDDLTLTPSGVVVVGEVTPLLTLRDLAAGANPWRTSQVAGDSASIREVSYYSPPTVTFASAAHLVVVEIDTEVGVVRILDYVVVHDCGRVVNPAIVEGQVTGGVLQGIGGALYEEMLYDDEGQPRTSSFMDYLLPTAAEAPHFILDHFESASPLNPLGVKGVGESGAIGSMAAVANAVEDGLRSFGVVVRRCPLSPDRVRELIRTAHATAGASSS